MRVGISGKGGVGKTTLAAGLARLWVAEGRRVIAIDADPDANLAIALGADAGAADACVPLSEMDDLIEERTGARPGTGGIFRLNPDVSDVVEKCGLELDGVTLLRMGTVERGGAGCMCSESSFLKAFLSHVLNDRSDAVVLDMEAGVEHLGRGTAESVDVLIVVVEPGARSVQTAKQVRRLAEDIGIPAVAAVANKVRDEGDEAFVRASLGDIPLLAVVRESDALRAADRDGRPAIEADERFASAVSQVAEAVERMASAAET